MKTQDEVGGESGCAAARLAPRRMADVELSREGRIC